MWDTFWTGVRIPSSPPNENELRETLIFLYFNLKKLDFMLFLVNFNEFLLKL